MLNLNITSNNFLECSKFDKNVNYTISLYIDYHHSLITSRFYYQSKLKFQGGPIPFDAEFHAESEYHLK